MTARRVQPPTPATPVGPSGDEGFSLIELITALAVFSILMVVVGGATLSGFSAIREATTRSSIQQQAQNAMESISRLVRYADVPEGQTLAVTLATATSVTMYTYSGTGSKNDVPYQLVLSVVTDTDGNESVISNVRTPTKPAGIWLWADGDGLNVSRRLLTVPPSPGAPLGLRYYACVKEDCFATRRLVTAPTTPAPLTLGATEVLESIEVSIGDPTLPDSLVTQSVKLVNLS